MCAWEFKYSYTQHLGKRGLGSGEKGDTEIWKYLASGSSVNLFLKLFGNFLEFMQSLLTREREMFL